MEDLLILCSLLGILTRWLHYKGCWSLMAYVRYVDCCSLFSIGSFECEQVVLDDHGGLCAFLLPLMLLNYCLYDYEKESN